MKIAIYTSRYNDGARYKGKFKKGKRHGKGTIEGIGGVRGDVYNGEWKVLLVVRFAVRDYC